MTGKVRAKKVYYLFHCFYADVLWLKVKHVHDKSILVWLNDDLA